MIDGVDTSVKLPADIESLKAVLEEKEKEIARLNKIIDGLVAR